MAAVEPRLGINEGENMKKLISLFVLIACLVLANVLPASAVPPSLLSSDELWKKADLVVIATAISNKDAGLVKNAITGDWVLVFTKFDVEVVLKGKLEQKIVPDKTLTFVTIKHYRYADEIPKPLTSNPPGFVTFNPKAKKRYLIFLSKKPNGDYEPFSGQWFPSQSFMRLENYYASEEKVQPKQKQAPKK